MCMCMCMCVCMWVVAAVARLLVGERGVAHKQLEELRGACGLGSPRLRSICSAHTVHVHVVHMHHAVRMRCACGVRAVRVQRMCRGHAAGGHARS